VRLGRRRVAPHPSDGESLTFGGRLKRASLVASMTLVTTNVWTGSPLLALWIGSRLEGDGGPTMGPIAAVVAAIGVLSFVLIRVLAVLDRTYRRLTGEPPTIRRDVPWLRSMRGDRPHETASSRTLGALDLILISSVFIVVTTFEVWFFFFSGSSFGGGSGRH